MNIKVTVIVLCVTWASAAALPIEEDVNPTPVVAVRNEVNVTSHAADLSDGSTAIPSVTDPSSLEVGKGEALDTASAFWGGWGGPWGGWGGGWGGYGGFGGPWGGFGGPWGGFGGPWGGWGGGWW